MPTIPYSAETRCLVSVRGHPFDRNCFDALFSDMGSIAAIMVDQPAAAQLMTPEGLAPYDVLVLYDMPGLDFADSSSPPVFIDPAETVKAGLRACLEAGIGVVAIHHALAGWPTWPDYGEWLGGRFLYKAGLVRGQKKLDSGYAHDVRQTFTLRTDHPLATGLGAAFSMTDEPYLAEIFDDSIDPFLFSDTTFTRDHFYSAEAAVAGSIYDNQGWDHPPGLNIAGWTKKALNSPLAYIQPGDRPATLADATYRRLVERAIRWASAQARRLMAG